MENYQIMMMCSEAIQKLQKDQIAGFSNVPGTVPPIVDGKNTVYAMIGHPNPEFAEDRVLMIKAKNGSSPLSYQAYEISKEEQIDFSKQIAGNINQSSVDRLAGELATTSRKIGVQRSLSNPNAENLATSLGKLVKEYY